mmetsp:Transcript_7905/g.21794  ORF Transcript_7905/g.21794 Transcript_7905/m.21794 type:complete len:89 (+) Transcript_7905:1037-1303(+)
MSHLTSGSTAWGRPFCGLLLSDMYVHSCFLSDTLKYEEPQEGDLVRASDAYRSEAHFSRWVSCCSILLRYAAEPLDTEFRVVSFRSLS